jgi:hypothetical protein
MGRSIYGLGVPVAKVRIDVRVEGALLLWVDAYAKRRVTTRTAVIEAALAEFRDACEGGPSVERGPKLDAVIEAKRAVSSTGSTREHARGAYWDMMRERQERLNKGGR